MRVSKIVIGVLTWRGYDVTRACLASLRSLNEWPVATLVVDAASGTNEGARLAAEFGPPVEALELRENGGVPAGYNAAIRWAAEQGADLVLLLNNDTVITDPAMLTRLAAAVEDDVAVVGPIVREETGEIFSAGGFMDWRRGHGYHRLRPLRTDRPYPAKWLDGPCLLVSVAAALRIGGLWPDYFMYWEELDWCVRAGRLGFRCVIEPRTSIVHARSTRASMRVRQLMLRNGILFMRRHGSISQNLTSLAWVGLYRAPGMVAKRLVRPREAARMAQVIITAFGWNLRDAWKHRRWRLPADGPDLSP